MSSYNSLAPFYDVLTRDVDYGAFVDLYDRIFMEYGVNVRDVIDLACGTGTVSCLLAGRGYEVIGVDASEDMLLAASDKADNTPCAVKPIFINQSLEELDLFGTASAAVCALDGINYIEPWNLSEVFYRISLFVEPGGVLIIDVLTPEELESRDGQTYLDETEDLFCLWQSGFDFDQQTINYSLDIFARVGELWERFYEEHTEYAHPLQFIENALKVGRFGEIRYYRDKVPGGSGRVFIAARRV